MTICAWFRRERLALFCGRPGAAGAPARAPALVRAEPSRRTCRRPTRPAWSRVGGAITEIVYALGEEKRLVGRDSTSIYPDAATKLPDVGYMRHSRRKA